MFSLPQGDERQEGAQVSAGPGEAATSCPQSVCGSLTCRETAAHPYSGGTDMNRRSNFMAQTVLQVLLMVLRIPLVVHGEHFALKYL